MSKLSLSAEEAKERLILPLDVATAEEAFRLVDLIGANVGVYKVGLQLFVGAGRELVCELKRRKLKVFLDLKFHDIPKTTVSASIEAYKLGVDMFNIHALAGSRVLNEVNRAITTLAEEERKEKPLLLGVTLLTSNSEVELKEIGMNYPLPVMVNNLAKLCSHSGFGGVVCSPQEVALIKESCGKDFLTVVPGVRPEWCVKDDQKRVATPGESIKNGADYLVIGRPITKADDPLEAIDKVVNEITAI